AHEQEVRRLGDPVQVPLREAAGPSWDFSKISIVPSNLRLQTKLAIGAVNDPLEQEADRVADQVMRMPDPDLSIPTAPPQVSRKCTACEEEEEKLQKEAAASEVPASVHEVLRSPGQPLDEATRAFFEPRFGYDFSRVRVHTDAAAEESANDVKANAYAV